MQYVKVLLISSLLVLGFIKLAEQSFISSNTVYTVMGGK